MLKSLQRLGYIPALPQVPDGIITYLRQRLDLPADAAPVYEAERSRYRYYQVLRAHLGLSSYSDGGKEAAYTMSDPADLINVGSENSSGTATNCRPSARSIASSARYASRFTFDHVERRHGMVILRP